MHPQSTTRDVGRKRGPLVVAGLLAFGLAVFAGLEIGLRYTRSLRGGGAVAQENRATPTPQEAKRLAGACPLPPGKRRGPELRAP